MSKPKILSFATMKGGTGKTNVAFNLVGFLAKENKKVLVMDFDSQGNMSSNFYLNQLVESYDSISDVLENDIAPKDVIIEHPIDAMPTVDIIPSDKELTATEMRLISRQMRHAILKRWLKKYKDCLEKYDYIICDTPPALSLSNINALFVSDSIIIVSSIGLHSIQGAMNIIGQWENLCEGLEIGNNIIGLLINKYDKRVKISKEFIYYVNHNPLLKELSFDTIIPNNIKLEETSMVNLPISYYNVKNVGYKAYIEFVKELKELEAI